MPLTLTKLNSLRSISIGHAGIVNTRLPLCAAGFYYSCANKVSTRFPSSYLEMPLLVCKNSEGLLVGRDSHNLYLCVTCWLAIRRHYRSRNPAIGVQEKTYTDTRMLFNRGVCLRRPKALFSVGAQNVRVWRHFDFVVPVTVSFGGEFGPTRGLLYQNLAVWDPRELPRILADDPCETPGKKASIAELLYVPQPCYIFLGICDWFTWAVIRQYQPIRFRIAVKIEKPLFTGTNFSMETCLIGDGRHFTDRITDENFFRDQLQ